MKGVISKKIAQLVALFVLGQAAIIVISYVAAGSHLREEIMKKVEYASEKEANRIDGWFSERAYFISALAIDYKSINHFTQEQLSNYLAAHLHDKSEYVDVYMGFPDGKGLFGGGWQPDYSQWKANERDWYAGAVKDGKKAHITLPYIDAEIGKLVITFAKAILDDDGKVSGVIACDVILDKLEDIVLKTKVADKSGAFMTDPDGLIIVHQNSEYAPDPENETFLDISKIANGIYSPLKNMTGRGQRIKIKCEDKIKRYVTMALIETTGWKLYATVPDGVVYAGTKTMLETILFISAIFMIITVFVSVFMVKNLNKLLAKASIDLQSVTGNVVTASKSLMESSSTLAQNSAHQAASIQETSSTMSEASSMVENNNENTHKALVFTQRTSSEIGTGLNDMRGFAVRVKRRRRYFGIFA